MTTVQEAAERLRRADAVVNNCRHAHALAQRALEDSSRALEQAYAQRHVAQEVLLDAARNPQSEDLQLGVFQSGQP